MEKKQYDLCLEILRRFQQQDLLGNLILIGSWSVVFYQEYFSSSGGFDHESLKTRDIDFLIPRPSKITHDVNIPALVEDLGFTVTRNSQGFMKLDHPDLILEFLVPERGAGQDKPVSLPHLKMNAVALRFLNFLTDNPIRARIEDFYVNLAHPINLALHKLIIAQRRRNKDKAVKDRKLAVSLLFALIKKGDGPKIRATFDSVPKPWRAKILKGLDPISDQIILTLIEPNPPG